jgi:glycerophosphoryl diester phosphodiesterase
MSHPAVIAHRGAHRGASREAPENTLAAFERALALGADGIELDVHRTADGAVVVHHDAVPHPTDGQSELAWRPFTTLSLAEVRRLRVAGTHAIPTLLEVLETVGDRLTLYCELKGAGVVEAAAPILRRHRGPCAMHSFDHRAVLRASELAPEVPRGILVASRLIDTRHALTGAKASAVWPQREFVDAFLCEEVHSTGGQVIAWTANDPFDITRLLKLGVDALCTDDVAGARGARDSTFGMTSA